MALADNYAPTKTLGNGATLVYSFSWDGISVDFVKVYSQNVATGVITEITTGITKALNSGSVGGTVTFLVAPASTVYIIIARQTPVSQTDPYSTSGGFPAATVENNFDKIVAIQQEASESLSRSLKYPIGTNVSTYSTQLPIPEALKYLRGNAGGTAYENSAISSTDTDYPGTIDYGTDASKPASPSAGDIYFAIDTKIIYVCASSGSWTQFNYSGAFFASLASTPSGAGVIPIANLATGTPDGTKFVRDDGTLQAPFTIASEAEAEAGSDNTKIMTPLRVVQSIAEQRLEVVYGTYTGDGNDNRDITIGFKDTTRVPKFVLVLTRSSGGGHWMFSGDTSGQAPVDGTAQTAGIKSLSTANQFRVGTNSEANGAGSVKNFLAVG